MPENPSRYIPALNYHRLTFLYDPLLRWVMREVTFKRRLVQQANLQPGMQVLDLGCGTGTLTILAKQIAPRADVTGLDGDPQVLRIAQNKASQAGVLIHWDKGLAFHLPYPDCSFDRVLTSLVFHHLSTNDKRSSFKEIYRVLANGGELHLVDFGAPRTLTMRIATGMMSRLEESSDNFMGLLPGMMTEAGFEVAQTGQFSTLFGPLAMIRARKMR
jgi:SAM-dependent methyltransferase